MGVNNKQIKSLIKDVCVQMGDKYAKKEALDIVYATGLVESKYEYIEQIGKGPARSFWQVEPSTAVDNCKNFISVGISSYQSPLTGITLGLSFAHSTNASYILSLISIILCDSNLTALDGKFQSYSGVDLNLRRNLICDLFAVDLILKFVSPVL